MAEKCCHLSHLIKDIIGCEGKADSCRQARSIMARYEFNRVTSRQNMTTDGHELRQDALANTVFGASLTLVAILMGVVAIFEGEVQTLLSSGLSEAATTPVMLRNIVVVFLMVCCWSSFWSYLYLARFRVNVFVFALPIALVIIALFFFVPYWVWVK